MKPMPNIYDINEFKVAERKLIREYLISLYDHFPNGILISVNLSEIEDYPEVVAVFNKYEFPEEFQIYYWW